jgi:hypothetical protein
MVVLGIVNAACLNRVILFNIESLTVWDKFPNWWNSLNLKVSFAHCNDWLLVWFLHPKSNVFLPHCLLQYIISSTVLFTPWTKWIWGARQWGLYNLIYGVQRVIGLTNVEYMGPCANQQGNTEALWLGWKIVANEHWLDCHVEYSTYNTMWRVLDTVFVIGFLLIWTQFSIFKTYYNLLFKNFIYRL